MKKNKKEKLKEYRKKWNKGKVRKAWLIKNKQRLNEYKNPEKRKKIIDRHYKKHKKERIESQRKYYYSHFNLNYDKYFARNIANKKREYLIKTNCEICFSQLNLELHHPNYDKPLSVMTLCRKCHNKIYHYGV
jgi:hypothetical protein